MSASTGLRVYERDLSIPARGGDAALAAPPPRELLQLVSRHLLLEGVPRPTSAVLEYARWKPGRSLGASYRVEFEDGETRLVQLKRFTGDKPAHLAARTSSEDHLCPHGDDRLRGHWIDVLQRTYAWSFPADRQLPGLARLLDLRRTAHILHRAGFLEPARIRKRKTRFELLRYKPERRALYRLDLALRREGEPSANVGLVARVLPPAFAEHVMTARTALADVQPPDCQPELVLAEAHTGILIERRLQVRRTDPDDFRHAAQAGFALARLHCARLLRVRSGVRRAPLADLEPLLRLVPGVGRGGRLALDELARLLRPRSRGSTPLTWVHGDFHPDQVLFDEALGAHRLMDFDLLAQGDPSSDLASWVGDQLFRDPELGFRDVAGELLEGYYSGGGARQNELHLRERVAEEIVRRSASALRRLERGAVQKAERGLQRALELPPTSPLRGAAIT